MSITIQTKNITILAVIALFFYSCSSNEKVSLTVTNKLSLDRTYETVEILFEQLPFTVDNPSELNIFDEATGKAITSQLIDIDKDGELDGIIFQPKLVSKASKKYSIALKDNKNEEDSDVVTYARLAPERLDDFTWENDKVAFRTYGPACEKAALDGTPGGTISSGIDCWLKKVNYSIIDKWYNKMQTGGTYHEDTGEGLDNYHVGISRGCGGFGIWQDDQLYTSNNFLSSDVHANGPLKTSFSLDYGTWSAGETQIKEIKQITTELGSNFSKYEINIEGSEQITIGITLHDQVGNISFDSLKGWFNYHTPHTDAFLSTAIVVDPSDYISHFVVKTEELDKSHLFIQIKVKENIARYESGFFWSKSEQFINNEEWEKYLSEHALRNSSPLEVSFL